MTVLHGHYEAPKKKMIVHVKMEPMEGILRKQRGAAGLEKEPLILSGWLRKGNLGLGPKTHTNFTDR